MVWCPARRHNTMIIKPKFHYEGQLPFLGNKAYFVVTYLPTRMFRHIFQEQSRIDSLLHWAQLTNLFVDTKYRRQGYGKQLLTLLKSWQDLTETNIIFLASPYRRRAGCDRRALQSFYTNNDFPQWADTSYHYRVWKIGSSSSTTALPKYNYPSRTPIWHSIGYK